MTPPKPRMQSQTERDLQGMAARKEREAAPVEVEPEVTGNYEGEELLAMRRRRPTDERIDKLESKHDRIDSKVDALHGDVREMRGELKSVLAVIVPERKEVHATERARIDSRTKIILGIVGLVGTALGILIGSGCS